MENEREISKYNIKIVKEKIEEDSEKNLEYISW